MSQVLLSRELLLEIAKKGDAQGLRNVCTISWGNAGNCKSLLKGIVKGLVNSDDHKLLFDAAKHDILPFVKLFKNEFYGNGPVRLIDEMYLGTALEIAVLCDSVNVIQYLDTLLPRPDYLYDYHPLTVAVSNDRLDDVADILATININHPLVKLDIFQWTEGLETFKHLLALGVNINKCRGQETILDRTTSWTTKFVYSEYGAKTKSELYNGYTTGANYQKYYLTARAEIVAFEAAIDRYMDDETIDDFLTSRELLMWYREYRPPAMTRLDAGEYLSRMIEKADFGGGTVTIGMYSYVVERILASLDEIDGGDGDEIDGDADTLVSESEPGSPVSESESDELASPVSDDSSVVSMASESDTPRSQV